MAQLKYCDKHNQVGFLRKPDESAGFAEIVDFLRGSNLRYALTTNPTIYDSLVKQFWQSATANTKADGSLEINATIDTIGYTIFEASIRDSLQLDDATGITMLPNAELFEGMGQIGYPIDGTFTFWKSFFTPQWRYLVHQHSSPPQEQASSQMSMDDLLQAVPKLLSRIDSLETDVKQTKLTMGNVIVKLVKKVKKLEGFLKRRNMVLSDSEEEEPEAQGRKSKDDPLDSSVQGLVTPSYQQKYKLPGITKSEKKTTKKEDISLILLKQPKLSPRLLYKSLGQREGKAPMISEETPKKSKEQILQEEASLAEAIRLDSLQKEEELNKYNTWFTH
ncbi:hypothetical protein Tco_0039924 [Tanacetum coccineum]